MPITPGVYQHLGFKAYWLFVLQKTRFVFAPLFFVIVIIASNQYLDFTPDLASIFNQVIAALFGLFALSILGAFVVSGIQYIAFSFMLDEHALKIRAGILNIDIEAIPYRQIQNVDIERSILYRLLSVSKIVILTAGTEDATTRNESAGKIPVLDKHLAMQVQEELLRRSNIEKTVVVSDPDQPLPPASTMQSPSVNAPPVTTTPPPPDK